MEALIHGVHALGERHGAKFITPPRHQISISPRMALAFDRKSMLMIQQVRSDLYRGKQEATRNIVEAASGVLEYYRAQETSGAMTTSEAQKAAMEQIRLLRYDGQDYYWINDLGPTMIMHPMQPKLDGQDLSKIKDPEGKELFNEMVKSPAAKTQTVNALLPSIIDTAANRKDMPDADFSRWVQPAQLAATIAFLLSDGAAAITGALIPVVGRV